MALPLQLQTMPVSSMALQTLPVPTTAPQRPVSSVAQDLLALPGDCPLETSFLPGEALRDVVQLAQDLLKGLNNPDFCDIRFLCKDGVAVSSSRLLLAARSPVFKSMLRNGMAETELTEISLPDITSGALLPTLEYLYTGGITTHKLTMQYAFEVLHASRFLLVPSLENYVMVCLELSLRRETLPHKLVWSFSRISELDPNVTMFVQAPVGNIIETNKFVMERLAIHMAWKLRYAKLDMNHIRTLSLEAVQCLLRFGRSANDSKFSLTEYLWLRLILLWAASKVSVEAEKALGLYLPDDGFLLLEDSKAAKGLRQARRFCPKGMASFVDPGLISQVKEQIAKLDHLEGGVKFRCIHPQILSKIVEPLDIIPSSMLNGAYKSQACEIGQGAVMKWVTSSASLLVLEQGCVLANPVLGYSALPGTFVTGSFIVCSNSYGARCKNHTAWSMMTMHRSSGVFEWEVTAEEPCVGLVVGIGVFKSASQYPFHDGWGLCSTGILVHDADFLMAKKYGKPFGERTGSVVRVHLDMTTRTCAFTIDGQRFGDGFFNLPHQLFPAVALCKGKVRVKLLSDPDVVSI